MTGCEQLTSDSTRAVIEKNTTQYSCAENEHHSQEYLILETYVAHIFITGNRGKSKDPRTAAAV